MVYLRKSQLNYSSFLCIKTILFKQHASDKRLIKEHGFDINYMYILCFIIRYGPPVRTGYVAVVENLSSRTSWQVSTCDKFIYYFACYIITFLSRYAFILVWYIPHTNSTLKINLNENKPTTLVCRMGLIPVLSVTLLKCVEINNVASSRFHSF